MLTTALVHFQLDLRSGKIKTYVPLPPLSLSSSLSVYCHLFQFRDELEDKLHFFVEECDHLQGFHLLCDWINGFGGLTSCIAQDLHDEYKNKGIFTVLSSPHDTPLNKVGVVSCKVGVAYYKLVYYYPQLPNFYPLILNHILAIHHLSEPSSLLLPLSPLVKPWQPPISLRSIESTSYNVRIT